MGMQTITKTLTPRRTGLIDRVRQAKAAGRKSIPLETAVDVYGAQNLTGQFKDRLNTNVSIRRFGTKIRLVIDPSTPSARPGARTKDKLKHTKMRKALNALKPGQVLVLNTPLEAHNFNGVRQSFRYNHGILLRTQRNCTALWVWKDRSVKV